MTDFIRRVYWDGYGIGPGPTGVAVHASNLKRELQKLDIDPVVLDKASTKVFFHSAPFWELKPLHPLRSLLEIGNVTRKLDPDRIPVVLHGLSNINLPVVIPWRNKVKTVITIHDLIPFFASESVSKAYFWQFSALLPRVVAVADRIVCVSDWTRRTLLDRFPGLAEKCVTIKNGCDGVSLPEEKVVLDKGEEESASNPIKILTIGRPEAYKRQDFFVGLVRRAKGKIKGTIVTNERGAAKATSTHKELIEKGLLKILVNIPNSELGQVYRLHDIYVHPSLFEGFCLPAAEALSAGLPVLFQKGSGIDEVVSSGCGVGMDANSSEDDWVEGITALNIMRRSSEFADHLQKYYRERSTWKQAAVDHKKLYTDLLST